MNNRIQKAYPIKRTLENDKITKGDNMKKRTIVIILLICLLFDVQRVSAATTAQINDGITISIRYGNIAF